MSQPDPLPRAVAETPEQQRRFFDAALDLLGEEGYSGLKLTRLCRRLGLTTGAFYHSFAGWRAFTDALLEHWYAERTLAAAERLRDEPDPARRLDLLLAAALDLRHGAESAIRVWAGVDPRVRDVLDRADRDRLDLTAAAFADLTGDPARARRLAQTALALLVGHEQLGAVQDPDTLAWALRAIRRLAHEAETVR